MARPFHLGVTANHGLFDPSMHGVDFLRDLIGRWVSGLDVTRLGSLAACVGTAPAAWRFLKAAWRDVYGWVRQFFIASVVIPGQDPLNRPVTNWVLANVVQFRNVQSFTARTQLQAGTAGAPDRAALLKKTRGNIQYLPHFRTVWFWHEGNLFVVWRQSDAFRPLMTNPAHDGVGGDDITIGCLGRSTEPIKRLFQTCQEYADKQAQYYVIIYSRFRMSWQPKSRKPIRRLDTVHFDDKLKRELLADIRTYLDPKTKRLYASRSMPYRRGYLFYGPPGTGKSSLSTALAGEFGLDLYEVKVPSVANDQDLEQMFHEVPPQCIVLLEDIDAIWTKRGSTNQDQQNKVTSNCTLSGLLNVLDGVGSPEGRIVIMTTNKPDQLDSALIRPGRVDMKILLGNISRKSAEQMFLRMFTLDADYSLLPSSEKDNDERRGGHERELDHDGLRRLASEFAMQIPEDTFTPSKLQGFFQLHLDSPIEAASSIAAWVERELSGTSSDDEIEIVTNGHAR